jgi:hypothetical protein
MPNIEHEQSVQLGNGNSAVIVELGGFPLKRFGFPFGWFDDALRPDQQRDCLTDVDGAVGVNGLNLFVEFKLNEEGFDHQDAQHRFLHGLASHYLNWCYIVVWRPAVNEQGAVTLVGQPPMVLRYARLFGDVSPEFPEWQEGPADGNVAERFAQELRGWVTRANDLQYVSRRTRAAALAELFRLTNGWPPRATTPDQLLASKALRFTVSFCSQDNEVAAQLAELAPTPQLQLFGEHYAHSLALRQQEAAQQEPPLF